MSQAQYVLAALTFFAWGLLLWKGRLAERLAACILIGLAVISPVLDDHSRTASMLLSIGGFVGLSGLALWQPRWWLIVAAGIQLVAALSHVAWLLLDTDRLWPAVTLRLLLWFFIIITALVGTAEGRWARYARSPSADRA